MLMLPPSCVCADFGSDYVHKHKLSHTLIPGGFLCPRGATGSRFWQPAFNSATFHLTSLQTFPLSFSPWSPIYPLSVFLHLLPDVPLLRLNNIWTGVLSYTFTSRGSGVLFLWRSLQRKQSSRSWRLDYMHCSPWWICNPQQ